MAGALRDDRLRALACTRRWAQTSDTCLACWSPSGKSPGLYYTGKNGRGNWSFRIVFHVGFRNATKTTMITVLKESRLLLHSERRFFYFMTLFFSFIHTYIHAHTHIVTYIIVLEQRCAYAACACFFSKRIDRLFSGTDSRYSVLLLAHAYTSPIAGYGTTTLAMMRRREGG